MSWKMNFSDNDVAFEGAENPVKCAGCDAYGEKLEFNNCENCGDYFCSNCREPITHWRNMKVCTQCKEDLTKDKGEDMEDIINRTEYLEER